jgi:hypothetical protein
VPGVPLDLTTWRGPLFHPFGWYGLAASFFGTDTFFFAFCDFFFFPVQTNKHRNADFPFVFSVVMHANNHRNCDAPAPPKLLQHRVPQEGRVDSNTSHGRGLSVMMSVSILNKQVLLIYNQYHAFKIVTALTSRPSSWFCVFLTWPCFERVRRRGGRKVADQGEPQIQCLFCLFLVHEEWLFSF